MSNNEFQAEENATLNLSAANTEMLRPILKKPYHPPTLSAPIDMIKTTRYFLQVTGSGSGLQDHQLEK